MSSITFNGLLLQLVYMYTYTFIYTYNDIYMYIYMLLFGKDDFGSCTYEY